jgi:hypothetical protein
MAQVVASAYTGDSRTEPRNSDHRDSDGWFLVQRGMNKIAELGLPLGGGSPARFNNLIILPDNKK